MAGEEFVLMWQWIVEWINDQGLESLWAIVETSRQLSPTLLDLESWLTMKKTDDVPAQILSPSIP